MKPEDSGEYKVTVTNSKGSTDVTTNVTVTDPIVTAPNVTFDFIQNLENITIKDGELVFENNQIIGHIIYDSYIIYTHILLYES